MADDTADPGWIDCHDLRRGSKTGGDRAEEPERFSLNDDEEAIDASSWRDLDEGSEEAGSVILIDPEDAQPTVESTLDHRGEQPESELASSDTVSLSRDASDNLADDLGEDDLLVSLSSEPASELVSPFDEGGVTLLDPDEDDNQAAREAEEKARKAAEIAKAEKKAKAEANRRAKQEAKAKAEAEAALMAKAEAEAEAKAAAKAKARAKAEAEAKAREAAEALAAEEARKAAEEQARQKAQEKARKAAEEKAAKEKAKAEAEAKRKAEEEAKAKAEAEAKAREAAEALAAEKAHKAAQEKARKEAEQKARKAAAEKAARAKARAEAEAKRKAEEEAKAKAEAKAREEAEAKRKAEEKAKAKAAAEAKKKAEREAKAKAEEEAKRKAEEEAKLKAEAEAKARADAEAKRKADQETEAKAKAAAKRKANAAAKRKAEEEDRSNTNEAAKTKRKAATKPKAKTAKSQPSSPKAPAANDTSAPAQTTKQRDLGKTFRSLISANGPISLAQFMGESNAHYYTSRDPLGGDQASNGANVGDFITAPEISQMFGELIGLWLADLWVRMGSSNRVQYVELGPGRGTLATDALRSAGRYGFEPPIHFVETSEELRKVQLEAFPGATHHHDLSTLPEDRPLLIVANEFFDALPVHQLVRAAQGWHEKMVGLDGEDFTFVAGSEPMDSLVPETWRSASQGTMIETSPAAVALMAEISTRLTQQGGAALIIDYGPLELRSGSTLQAIKDHKHVDPLAHPGEADLTAHVDFELLQSIAVKHGAEVMGIEMQGDWLRNLGIDVRLEALQRKEPDKADVVQRQYNRLVADDQMGTLFKVLGICGRRWPIGVGFDQ